MPKTRQLPYAAKERFLSDIQHGTTDAFRSRAAAGTAKEGQDDPLCHTLPVTPTHMSRSVHDQLSGACGLAVFQLHRQDDSEGRYDCCRLLSETQPEKCSKYIERNCPLQRSGTVIVSEVPSGW